MNSKTLKIAIFHCGFVYSGGGERIVLEQARGLRKRGYRIEVYAPTIDEKLCFPGFLKELGVKMFLPSFIDWLPFRDAIRMTATSVIAPFLAFNFKNTDVFFGANQPGAWLAYCMAKVLKKPYFIYLNQPNRLVYPRNIDKKTGWQNKKDYYVLAKIIKLIKPFVVWVDKISIQSARAILVNGSYIGKKIARIYKCQTVDCPGGTYYIDKNKLKIKKKDIYSSNLWVNNIRIKKPYILISNRHEPQKRFDYVIRAFKLVLKQFPDVRLVIPGAYTSYTKDIIKLIKRLDLYSKVILPGQISESNLKKLYQNSVVHCYPSPDEDFGLGPLEAGGFAVPTVAWNHGGPTVTIVHKKTGYLAKPFLVSDYTKGILWFLKKPKIRKRIGLNAWELVKNNFSWDRHVDIIEKEIIKANKVNS